MEKPVISQQMLAALHKYFSGQINTRDAAKEAGLAGPNRFLDHLRDAYKLGYVTIRNPINHELSNKIRLYHPNQQMLTRQKFPCQQRQSPHLMMYL